MARVNVKEWAKALDPADPSKRSILNWLLGGSLVAFLAATLYPIIRFLYPTTAGESFAKEWVDVASITEVPVKGGKKVAFANKPVYVIHPIPDDYRAYSAICTHLGCIISWDQNRQQFLCPCHVAIFDINGNVVSGPAPRPLPKYKVQVREDKVYIGGLMEGEKL